MQGLLTPFRSQEHQGLERSMLLKATGQAGDRIRMKTQPLDSQPKDLTLCWGPSEPARGPGVPICKMGRNVGSLPGQAAGVFSKTRGSFSGRWPWFPHPEPAVPDPQRHPASCSSKAPLPDSIPLRAGCAGGHIPLEDSLNYQVDLEHQSSQQSKLGA